MQFLSLNKWLTLFNLKIISYEQFIKLYKVKSSRIYKLENYIKKNNITKKNIKILYKVFILNKETYLTNFFNTSLKITKNTNLNIIKNISLSNSKNKQYKNIIRNIYFKDILLNTSTDIPNLPSYLTVLFDLFNKHIIDYKLLAPSSIDMIKNKQFSSILSGYYFRASIMNPALVFYISKKILKGKKIFSPTLGWSSYMYGFLSNNNTTEYVGTDVISKVCKNTEKLGHLLFPNKEITIYCSPSENLLTNKKFMNKYKNYFDIIFFSPPYYKLEQYKGKLQSINQYKTYEDWLEKYWDKTIQLCKHILSKKGRLGYIISGYKKVIKLPKDMNKITKKYFKLYKSYTIGNTNINITKHRELKETLYCFKHK